MVGHFEIAKAIRQSESQYMEIKRIENTASWAYQDYDAEWDIIHCEHLITQSFGLCRAEKCRCSE